MTSGRHALSGRVAGIAGALPVDSSTGHARFGRDRLMLLSDARHRSVRRNSRTFLAQTYEAFARVVTVSFTRDRRG